MSPDTGKQLYHYQDEDIELEVREDDKQRWLHLGSDFIQSAMNLMAPQALTLYYLQFMLASLLFNPAPKRVWVLGLGGGSLIRFFQHYLPETQVDVVELNPHVIDVAKRYFLLEETANVHIHCMDAVEFVREKKTVVDMIFVDIATKTGLPKPLYLNAFYRNCLKALKKKGVFAFNMLSHSDRELQKLIKRLRDIFTYRHLCLDVPGYENIISFCFKDIPELLSLEGLKERAFLLEENYPIQFSQFLLPLFKINPSYRGLLSF